MWHEQAGTALSAATREVLEMMCFVDAGEITEPPPQPPPSIAAQVEFRGHWTGRCMVEMPESCARIIAGNFMGMLDPSSVEPIKMIELLCEFTNMICGGTITRLRCAGIVTLAPPHLIWEWPGALEAAQNPTVERWLDTGDGVVRVAFETRAAA